MVGDEMKVGSGFDHPQAQNRNAWYNDTVMKFVWSDTKLSIRVVIVMKFVWSNTKLSIRVVSGVK